MDEIDDVFVARLMTSDIHTVTPDTLVEDAAAVLLDNDISSALVVDDDGALVGILTTTDFVDIVAKSQPKAETTVERYMTRDPDHGRRAGLRLGRRVAHGRTRIPPRARRRR